MEKTALVGVISTLDHAEFFRYKNKTYQINPKGKTKKEFQKDKLVLKKGMKTY